MATKTIALRAEAYDRLRQARLHPGEPFSDVVLRARWPNIGITSRELLARYDREGPFLSEDALDRIGTAKRLDKAPVNKWKTR